MEVTSGTTSVTPGLNGSVIPVKLAAKARWADLKSQVNKTVDTKGCHKKGEQSRALTRLQGST